MSHRIGSASAHWLREPLRRPYELSFGAITHFDLVIVRVTDETGRVGYGESCPVPPYSGESADEVWEATCGALPTLVGADAGDAMARLAMGFDGMSAFASVAPATAVESLLDPPRYEGELAMPIVGTVQSHDDGDLDDEVHRLIAAGYRTLKVKIGFDPAEDARQIGRIQRLADGRARLRLDANEAWTPLQMSAFLDGLDPTGVELIEQPFPRDRWDWVRDLTRTSPSVPIMLDESIDTEESIERARDVGASIVKLKLMKCGTRANLRRRMRFASELGLSVVVGNGIAGTIDNWYEALCTAGSERAGEMNGNLKIVRDVVGQRPLLHDGELRFPAGFRLYADEAELDGHSRRQARC